MKYIKKMIIENFQSHKYSQLEFKNALNVIVGESDSGKTAILRALKWVLYNEPSGDYYIRKGETFARVVLIFNDNSQVERYRDKSKNQYIVIDNKGNKEVYEGFGVNVPKEVRDITGIYKVNLDQNESRIINIADQLEGAFLLSEKGGTKASSIGRLIGANVIDDALREGLSDLRRENNSLSNVDKELGSIGQELESFQYLDEFEERLESVKKIEKELRGLNKLLEIEEGLNKSYKENRQDLNKCEEILAGLDMVHQVELMEYKLKDRISLYENLGIRREKLEVNKKNIKANEDLMEALKNIDEIRDLEIGSKIDALKILEAMDHKKNLLEARIKEEEIRLELMEDLSGLDLKLGHIDESLLKMNNLRRVHQSYRDVGERIARGQEYYSRFIDLDSLGDDTEKIDLYLGRYDKLDRLRDSYDSINQSILKGEAYLEDISSKMLLYLEEYRELLLEQGSCPFCFTEIDEEYLDQIINNYMGEI